MKQIKFLSLLSLLVLAGLINRAYGQIIFTTNTASWTYSNVLPAFSPATGSAVNQYTVVPASVQTMFNSFNAALPATTGALPVWTPRTGGAINGGRLTGTFNITLPQGKCLDNMMTIKLMIDDSCTIRVNGGPAYTFSGGPALNWGLVHSITVPNNFVAGSNTIQIDVNNLAASYNWVIAKFIVDTIQCGQTSCASSICYWNTIGNFITPASNNLLGTLSNHDIRIVSNSIQRGVVSAGGDFGFGTIAPTNRVHIRSRWGNASGLRLEDMPNTMTAISNPTNKVLSVDSLGNVILVRDSIGGSGSGAALADNGLSLNGAVVQLGESCSRPTGLAALQDDRAIPMNFHNLLFKDPDQATNSMSNRIGIGINSCSPLAKLHVTKSDANSKEFESVSILAENSGFNPNGSIMAIKGTAYPVNQSNTSIGGWFGSKNSRIGYGVVGTNFDGIEESYGGYFVSSSDGRRSYGIYADALNDMNGPGGPNYAGYFNGDVFSVSGFYASDERIKKNIRPMDHALDIISQLNPKTYEFDRNRYPSLHLPANAVNYGLIAQELEQVLPTLVSQVNVPHIQKESGLPAGMSEETIKAVNYVELIPILIQGMKEQQSEIELLKERLNRLESSQPAYLRDSTLHVLNIGLSDKNVIALGQNVPNPFDRYTSIPYNVPSDARKASIQFNTVDGKAIRSVDITERGAGVINIYAGELSAGIYTYTLVVDGRPVATKKMEVHNRM